MGVDLELWLVRHGETEWSLSGAHTSRTDIPLTERGRQRALELRAHLDGVHFDAVLSSPMKRALETCSLAGFGEQVQLEPGLLEWNYGVYEGKTTRQIRESEPGWSVWTNEMKGGESVDAVGQRADAVIQTALAAGNAAGESKQGRVALFAHAHILRILAARWIGLQASGGRLFTLGTGSLSRLGWERETRVVASWNRTFEE